VAGNGAAKVTGIQENSAPKTDGLVEAIVSRGNMMAAFTRVMRNKRAPGVDDMPGATDCYPHSVRLRKASDRNLDMYATGKSD
jgi:hypothetical protein